MVGGGRLLGARVGRHCPLLSRLRAMAGLVLGCARTTDPLAKELPDSPTVSGEAGEVQGFDLPSAQPQQPARHEQGDNDPRLLPNEQPTPGEAALRGTPESRSPHETGRLRSETTSLRGQASPGTALLHPWKQQSRFRYRVPCQATLRSACSAVAAALLLSPAGDAPHIGRRSAAMRDEEQSIRGSLECSYCLVAAPLDSCPARSGPRGDWSSSRSRIAIPGRLERPQQRE
jgi:hypothetical protein